MWFKNLTVYRFAETPDLNPESLESALAEHSFQPCPKHQPASQGWTFPLGRDGEQLVHTTNGCLMICLKREERVLPAASLRERLEEKLAEIEENEGRKVRGKEKIRLKEELTLDMLPHAFTRSSVTYAYLDPKHRWLVVDTATSKKAEELTGYLRQSLGTLPIKPLQVNDAPAAVMTNWLREGKADGAFHLGEDCVLKDPQNEGTVTRMKQQDLVGDEIEAHLNAGKRVSQLAVEFHDRVGCMLDEALLVRRVKFLDVVLDEADNMELESAAEQFDADFSLMSAELGAFLDQLIEVFGGEAE